MGFQERVTAWKQQLGDHDYLLTKFIEEKLSQV